MTEESCSCYVCLGIVGGAIMAIYYKIKYKI